MSKRTRRRLAAGIKRGQFKQSVHEITPAAMGFSSPVKVGALTVLDGVADPSDPRRAPFVMAWLAELQGELGHWEAVHEVPEVDLEDACKRAALTPKQTEAALMYVELRSEQQVAHYLLVSRGAVRDRLEWARRKLRAFFDKTPLDSLAV